MVLVALGLAEKDVADNDSFPEVLPAKKKPPCAFNALMFTAGLLTTSMGLAALIIGALAVASILSVFTAPVGIGLLIGGGLTLAAGIKMTFFSSCKNNNKLLEAEPQLDNQLSSL